MLWLCLSQTPDLASFTFRGSGVRVFSIEEALYYVYHNWKEAEDDILSREMIRWMDEIGLNVIAAKMRRLADVKSFAERVLGFLQLADYFEASELRTLGETLEAWGRRFEWEKLKEQADFYARCGRLTKAVEMYLRALAHDENPKVLNNLALTLMQLGRMQEAFMYLARAHAHVTARAHAHVAARAHAHVTASDNNEILQNYIEAAIFSGNFDKAETLLSELSQKQPDSAQVAYLEGQLHYEKKQYAPAIQKFEAAMVSEPKNELYIFMAAQCYSKMRKYTAALDILNMTPTKSAGYYTKQADIYAAGSDYAKAASSMQAAINAAIAPTAAMYAKLAGYLRLDYAPLKAAEAIERALQIDSEHELVQLENARVKKALGNSREYQAALAGLLAGLRGRYREQQGT